MVGPTDETVICELEKSLGLGEELDCWYRESAPRMEELDFGGNPLQMYEPEELTDLQMNFSYNLQNRKRDPEWREDWIVIADKGLDPVIYDKKTKGVYFARHDQEQIILQRLSPDLKGWIATLVVLCEVCYLTYQGQLLDDNGEWNPKIMLEIGKRLEVIIPNECVENWRKFLE